MKIFLLGLITLGSVSVFAGTMGDIVKNNAKEISESALLYNWGNSGVSRRVINTNSEFICDKAFTQTYGKLNFRKQFRKYLIDNMGLDSQHASSLSESVTSFTTNTRNEITSDSNGIEYEESRCPTVEELENYLSHL